MNLSYDLQKIIPDLLLSVPELELPYQKMVNEEEQSAPQLSQQDIEELNQISRLHNLPKRDLNKPGVTIVFEQLLVDLMLRMASRGEYERLKEIIDWIEELAAHPEFAVRNLVAISICEPLITTHEDSLSHFVPLMGKKTKALCTMQFEQYLISDKTKRLFGIVEK